MKTSILTLLFLAVCSCTPVKKSMYAPDRPGVLFHGISIGMSKAEVLEKGKYRPSKTVASEGTEYFVYKVGVGSGVNEGVGGVVFFPKYYIRFIKGKAESMGKIKDLDPAEQRLIKQKD